jgi:integrative and conjugative element protein (TIGR02256 family)
VAADPQGLHFERPAIGAVKIAEAALDAFTRFVQFAPDSREAGGVLIGRHILHTSDVVVDTVTTPLKGDRGTRTRFHRHAKGHQEILDRAWAESGGTSVYLGEWHTHPEPTPTPSSIDLGDWARRLRSDTVEAPFLLFVIVGQHDICVWEGSRGALEITQLRPRLRAGRELE